MPSCAVVKCHSNNRVKHGIQFHRFPKDKKICELWIKFCKSEKPLNLNNATICSLHFRKEDYTLKPFLKEAVQPSMNTQCLCGKCQRKRRYNWASASSDSSSSDGEEETPQQIEEKIKIEVDNNDDFSAAVSQKISGIRLEEETQKRLNLEKQLKVEIQRNMTLKNLLSEERRKRIALEVKLNFERQRQKAAELRATKAIEAMNKVFTPMQIQVLKTGQHPHRWDHDSIIKGLGLRAATSKKIYEYMRTNEHLPLPSFSTLTHWVQDTFAITPGETSQTLNLLKLKLPHMSEADRNVVLLFDEMQLNPVLCYDRYEDRVYGPCATLQITVVRSLTANWTQPIMFCFDEIINKETIFNVIKELELIGLRVRGIVSDFTDKNVELWKQLNISSETRCSFDNVVNPSRKVYMFADAVFMLMSLRDHILEYGMTMDGRIILHPDYFYALIEVIEPTMYKICTKINFNHYNARGDTRDQVIYAIELLSNTVANTLKTNFPNFEEGARFIEYTDKMFDVMNSFKKMADKEERCGLGVHYEKQMEVIREFESLIGKVRIGNQVNVLPLQEGFLVTLQSLRCLYEDLVKDNKIDCLLTSRLSLDCVHDVGKKLRHKDNPHILPNAVEAKAQLRLLLIGANKDVVNNPAEENPSEGDYISSQVLGNIPELVEEVLKNKDPDNDILLPEIMTEDLDQKYAQLIQEVYTEHTIEKVEDFCHSFKPELNYEYVEEVIEASCTNFEVGLDSNLTGGAKKKKKVTKYKEAMWVLMLTRSGVKISPKWYGKFKSFEDDFNTLHNNTLDCINRDPSITTKLVKILSSKWPKLDNRILKRYARLRLQIRLRYLIKKYEIQNQQVLPQEQWVFVEQQ